MLHWSKDKKEAIERKELQFKSILDELFENNFNVSKISNKDLSKEDQQYLDVLISKVKVGLK